MQVFDADFTRLSFGKRNVYAEELCLIPPRYIDDYDIDNHKDYTGISRLIHEVQHPELTFLVTPVGCGTAGYTPAEVAPLFAAAKTLDNVHLPYSFWKYIAE